MERFALEIAAAALHEFSRGGWAFPLGVGLELLFPRTGAPVAGRLKGAILWATYIVVVGAIIPGETRALRGLGLRPLLSLGPFSPWFIGFGAAILAAFVSDFFYYWCHRLQHTALLWRFHAVHHSIRDMNALNSFHHWTEEPVHFFFLGLPLAVTISVTGMAQQIFTALIVLQTVYIHTPSRLNFGPFGLLVDNRFHRIHHSMRPEHRDRNFGVFTTLWDRLFGTAYLPERGEWPEVGLDDQPEANGVLDYLFRPFTYPRTVG